jgi:hypothetical protein
MHALGHWLRRRWYHCHANKLAAQAELNKLDILEDTLRKEWAAQVREQTKPAPREYFNFVVSSL